MRDLAQKHTRWGSPQLHDVLKREGLVINHKRTERIYNNEKLSLRTKKRKKRPGLRIAMPPAQRANQQWAMDFIEDRTAGSRRIKIFTLIDEYTKESLAMEADTSISGVRVALILTRVAMQRGFPEVLRSDNGAEFTSRALFDWTQAHKVLPDFIEPGKPTQNPFIESFHSRFRDECLNENWFVSLPQARVIIGQWRSMYNSFRPHSSLNGLTPHEFARRLLLNGSLSKNNESQQHQTAPSTTLMTGT